MKAELYMISSHEEYANMHMCRRHWNYNWRGRRGHMPGLREHMRVRKELFGGLLQTPDGTLMKLDHEAYDFFSKYLDNCPVEEICNHLNISVEEALEAISVVNRGRGDNPNGNNC